MTLSQRALIPVVSAISVALTIVSAGCGGSAGKSDAQLQNEIVSNMHTMVMMELAGLKQAAQDLQTAAPATFAAGWDLSQTGGSAALAGMKEAWTRTRLHWERTEGTLAPMFPPLDESMDSRYEDMVAALGTAGDPNPFDGTGMTGMHAIERILFAPGPSPVVMYESTLPGYQRARWPATDQEAADFKSGLCQKLVDDTTALLDMWKPMSIDLGVVFKGLTGLMGAQEEKVSLAGMNQAESRYSDTTMADLRSNLAGTRAIYMLFGGWLATKVYGITLDSKANAEFDRLEQTYTSVPGDTVPAPPDTWTVPPSIADAATPFGLLYENVVQEVDPSRSGSAVDIMNHIAQALGLPQFTPGQN